MRQKKSIREKKIFVPALFALFFISLVFASKAQAQPYAVNEFPIPTGGSQPKGIALGSDGNLWFVENVGNKIGRITPQGAIAEFNIPTPNSQPVHITSGPDGNLWFTESATDKIGVITTGGQVLNEFPVTGGSSPRGIVTGPDGNLWFTEFNTGGIGRITTAGAVNEFNVAINPRQIAVGPHNINLWYTESASGQDALVEFSPTSTSIVGSPIFVEPGSQPVGITSGPDGNLWFTEFLGLRVGQSTLAGAIAEFPTDGSATLGSPVEIAPGPDGNMWFTEQVTGGLVGVVAPDLGFNFQFFTPTGNSTPDGIVAGPDENVWFTESSGNQIGQVVIPYATLSGATSVSEPANGSTDITYTVTLTSNGGNDPSNPVTVDFATSDGSAVADNGDYNPANGTLTFPPGVTTQTFTVTVNAVGDPQGTTKTLNVAIGNPFFAGLGNPNSTVLTITQTNAGGGGGGGCELGKATGSSPKGLIFFAALLIPTGILAIRKRCIRN